MIISVGSVEVALEAGATRLMARVLVKVAGAEVNGETTGAKELIFFPKKKFCKFALARTNLGT